MTRSPSTAARSPRRPKAVGAALSPEAPSHRSSHPTKRPRGAHALSSAGKVSARRVIAGRGTTRSRGSGAMLDGHAVARACSHNKCMAFVQMRRGSSDPDMIWLAKGLVRTVLWCCRARLFQSLRPVACSIQVRGSCVRPSESPAVQRLALLAFVRYNCCFLASPFRAGESDAKQGGGAGGHVQSRA